MKLPVKQKLPIFRLSCSIVSLTSVLIFCGCSNAPDRDVVEFIQNTKNEKSKGVERLPNFPKFEPYQYTASNIRNPFELQAMGAPKKVVYTGPTPDKGRARELLESYPLDSLRMVGTLERSGTYWALIKDPHGIVHRVGVGNYMGENYGKIEKISEKMIELHEFVSDGEGGYRERNVQLRLSNEANK